MQQATDADVVVWRGRDVFAGLSIWLALTIGLAMLSSWSLHYVFVWLYCVPATLLFLVIHVNPRHPIVPATRKVGYFWLAGIGVPLMIVASIWTTVLLVRHGSVDAVVETIALYAMLLSVSINLWNSRHLLNEGTEENPREREEHPQRSSE